MIEPNQVLDSCESTNDIVKEFAKKNLPHGTWIASKVQTKGRGQYGNYWKSDPGNLFLSFLTRRGLNFFLGENAHWLPLSVATAVLPVLDPFAGAGGNFFIKPPNDVLYKDKKVAGILCENLTVDYSVIGIGINCNTRPEITSGRAAYPPVCLKEILKSEVNLDELRASLIGSLMELFDEIDTNGLTNIEMTYSSLLKD
jgi:BirA family transcriptional regulator, biotin operon repressor / biotin---[acetyl-CoA-carboxylase] ligase